MTMTHAGWPGLIEKYRAYLPVSDATPVVTLLEGNTPLIPLDRLRAQLGLTQRIYAKYEGLNPTGSFKDRGMTMAISKAKEAGSQAVMCASTGNTSASAAAYSARAGMQCVVLIPNGNIALGKLSLAMIHGAKVLAIDPNHAAALLGMARVDLLSDHAVRAAHKRVDAVLARNPSDLEALALRAEIAMEDEDYNAALQTLARARQQVSGPGAAAFGYWNDAVRARLGLDTLKRNRSATGAVVSLVPLPDLLAEPLVEALNVEGLLDLALLPPYERLAHYFHFSVYGLSLGSQGLTLKVFAPTPSGLAAPR